MPRLSAQFLNELQAVNRALFDSEVAFLAERFESWRNHKRATIREYLEKLPEDDPLLCPVSLLGTMQYGRLETAHTRTLAWLLDPRAEHGLGDRLPRVLVGHFRPEWCSEKLLVDSVVSEHPVQAEGEDGFLDIILRGHTIIDSRSMSWVCVVEAKIDHQEGYGQLNKYDNWLRSQTDQSNILRIFLPRMVIHQRGRIQPGNV